MAAPLLTLPGDAPAKVLCPHMAAAWCCWQSMGRSLPGGLLTPPPRCGGWPWLRTMPWGEDTGGSLPWVSDLGGCTSHCQGAGINHPSPSAGLCRWGCSCAQHLPRGCAPASLQAQEDRGECSPKARPCWELLWKVPLCGAAQLPQPALVGGNFNRRTQALASRQLWEDGATVVACGSWLAVSLHPCSRGARQGEHPARLGQDRQHPPRRVEGVQADVSGTGLAPQELQVQAQLPHPLPAPKRFEESPGIQHGPQTPGFCTTRLFPTWEAISHRPGPHIPLAQRWSFPGSSAAATGMEQEGRGSVVQPGARRGHG